MLFSGFDMGNLTKHFSINEFFVGEAECSVTELRVERIKSRLILPVLEPLRCHLHQPVIITSGYRNPEHNRRVGGHPDSHHLMLDDKSAVDIWTFNLQKAYTFLSNNQEKFQYAYWEVIKGFIHISGKCEEDERKVKLWLQGYAGC